MVLGCIGKGATSVKNATALLADLIKANGGKAKFVLPATEAHWTEGIEAVADFAVENEYPLVLVTDDSSASYKPLKGYLSQASEKIKVTKPVNKVVQIVGGETNAKLLILWDDEDNDCYTALEAADQNEVEALDLCAGLHKLEFTDPDGGEEQQEEGDDEGEQEPESDDLDEMDEGELQDLAEELGLDVEDYPEWDDVRVAIREAREAEGGEDNEGLPTADEVMDWDFATLKAFAQEHGIEVPPRSKTFGYRNAITAWLEGGESTTVPDDDEGETMVPGDDDGELPVLEDDGWREFAEGLKEDLAAVLEGIDKLTTGIADFQAELKEQVQGFLAAIVDDGKAPVAPPKAPAAKKAVSRPAPASKPAAAPAKATAVKKAAPAKTVSRPKAPAAPKETQPERPLAPFMHLLGKKLTKTQAREIMIANASKGRGRPTEDERRLVRAAQELVPQV